jgi:hypothetical protein
MEQVVRGQKLRLVKRLATGLAVMAAGVITMGSVASAAPKPGSHTTLHFFSKHTGASYFPSDGTNIPNGTALVPGDIYTYTDADYVGNHRHHAKKATGTDFITCTYTTETTGVCDGALSLGDSMIVITRTSVDLTKNATLPIVTGTGSLSKIENGSVVISGVSGSRNDDLVISFDEPALPPV